MTRWAKGPDGVDRRIPDQDPTREELDAKAAEVVERLTGGRVPDEVSRVSPHSAEMRRANAASPDDD